MIVDSTDCDLLTSRLGGGASVMITDHNAENVTRLQRHNGTGTMSSSQDPLAGNDGATAEEGVSVGSHVAPPRKFVDLSVDSTDNPGGISLATITTAV